MCYLSCSESYVFSTWWMRVWKDQHRQCSSLGSRLSAGSVSCHVYRETLFCRSVILAFTYKFSQLSLFSSLKNSLKETWWNLFADQFINSHPLFSRGSIDITRKKLIFVTLGTLSVKGGGVLILLLRMYILRWLWRSFKWKSYHLRGKLERIYY